MKKQIFAVATGLTLAACGSPAVDDPGFMSGRFSPEGITGSYNPAGYTAAQVQAQVRSQCVNETIGSYSEAPGEDGLVAFTVVCAQGSKVSNGILEIERGDDQSVLVEVFDLSNI